MEFEVAVRYLSMTLEVVLLDLLLSSDNIVMIALACRSLPAAKRRVGLLLGTGAVIILRVLLITGARFVLEIPGLKLLGGIALVVIGINLIRAADASTGVAEDQGERGTTLWSAVTTIVVADLFMSVDNVLGMAAIARASPLILFMGIAMSVPLLAAIYVLAQVAIMRQSEPSAAAMRPEPRVKSWFVSNKHTVSMDYALSAAETSAGPSESDARAAPLRTSRMSHILRRLRWPDRAEWPIYERWGIGSLGATGLLLFALKPLQAPTTVLAIVAVLAVTLAPNVQATLRRKGWSNAVAVAAVCVGLAAIAGVLLLFFAATGWLGPIFR